jgi:DNA-binding transcriptional ArsR family regulator
MARAAGNESVFQAIACPTRRALLDVLAGGESNVSTLVASLDVTQSAVSQQLAVLKGAGLVGERSEGKFRYYSLRAQPLAEVRTWLNRYRAHIERQLDALGEVLDAMPDEPDDLPPTAPTAPAAPAAPARRSAKGRR